MLLGGGMSSRLFQRVREELGLAYSVYTFQSFHADVGVQGVYVGTAPETRERRGGCHSDGADATGRERGITGRGARGRKEPAERADHALAGERRRRGCIGRPRWSCIGEPYQPLDEMLAQIDADRRPRRWRPSVATFFAPDAQTVLSLGPGATAH